MKFSVVCLGEWSIPQHLLEKTLGQLSDGVIIRLAGREFYPKKGGIKITAKLLQEYEDGHLICYFWVTNDGRRKIIKGINELISSTLAPE